MSMKRGMLGGGLLVVATALGVTVGMHTAPEHVAAKGTDAAAEGEEAPGEVAEVEIEAAEMPAPAETTPPPAAPEADDDEGF